MDFAPGGRSGAPIAVKLSRSPDARSLAAQSVLSLQAAVREHGLAGLPPTEIPAAGRLQLDDWL
jgi:hypothetical protein